MATVALQDVMSPEMYQGLRSSRKGALSIFRCWRCGLMNNEEAARSLIRIYNSYFGWKIEYCGYGPAHPYCIFASRLLRSAKILMGEEWVSYRV